MNKTAYYTSLILPLVVYAYIGYSFYDPTDQVSTISFLKLYWLLSALLIVPSIFAMFKYGHPKEITEFSGIDPNKTLIVAYVTRGENIEALKNAILTTAKSLSKVEIDFVIEVTTETDANLIEWCDWYNVVPKDYQTEHKSKYKSRALTYALDQRSIRLKEIIDDEIKLKDFWVLHMDEETALDITGAVGVAKHMHTRRHNVIGQGEIKYNEPSSFGKNFVTMATDMIRTGDNLGRFRFQYNLFNKPLFGMSGSFFLCNFLAESKIGFDFGENASIAEDALFGFKATELGYKFAWMDGFVREQSPFTVKDLMKQRRRWFTGLWQLVYDQSIDWQIRSWLTGLMIIWSLAWISPLLLITTWMVEGYLPLYAVIMFSLIGGGFVSMYAVGAYRNLSDMNWSFIKKLSYYIAIVLFVPVASVIEASAVAYAIIRPVKTFEVIKK